MLPQERGTNGWSRSRKSKSIKYKFDHLHVYIYNYTYANIRHIDYYISIIVHNLKYVLNHHIPLYFILGNLQ